MGLNWPETFLQRAGFQQFERSAALGTMEATVTLVALSQLRICRTPPPLRVDPVLMEDAQCAETIEKSIFQSLFFELS